MISHAELVAEAERRGMPGRTLEQVQACIADAKKRAKGKNAGLDVSMARLMLLAGRLQPAAREWLAKEYPQ
jgi:hypothetical protein